MSEHLERIDKSSSIALNSLSEDIVKKEFEESSLNFEKRLSEIKIPQNEVNKYRIEEASGLLFDKVIGCIPCGRFVKLVLDWNDNVILN